jgi:hypothetical protein
LSSQRSSELDASKRYSRARAGHAELGAAAAPLSSTLSLLLLLSVNTMPVETIEVDAMYDFTAACLSAA